MSAVWASGRSVPSSKVGLSNRFDHFGKKMFNLMSTHQLSNVTLAYTSIHFPENHEYKISSSSLVWKKLRVRKQPMTHHHTATLQSSVNTGVASGGCPPPLWFWPFFPPYQLGHVQWWWWYPYPIMVILPQNFAVEKKKCVGEPPPPPPRWAPFSGLAQCFCPPPPPKQTPWCRPWVNTRTVARITYKNLVLLGSF